MQFLTTEEQFIFQNLTRSLYVIQTSLSLLAKTQVSRLGKPPVERLYLSHS